MCRQYCTICLLSGPICSKTNRDCGPTPHPSWHSHFSSRIPIQQLKLPAHKSPLPLTSSTRIHTTMEASTIHRVKPTDKSRRRATHPGRSSPMKEEMCATALLRDDGDEEDEAEVEMRVRTLQRLVPGGENMPVDRLLEETAEYIAALQGQVSAMRSLTMFLERLEKEKRMLGG